MKCELCGTNDSAERRICQECIEMIGRLDVVDGRMRNGEQCAAQRLAAASGARQGASNRG